MVNERTGLMARLANMGNRIRQVYRREAGAIRLRPRAKAAGTPAEPKFRDGFEKAPSALGRKASPAYNPKHMPAPSPHAGGVRAREPWAAKHVPPQGPSLDDVNPFAEGADTDAYEAHEIDRSPRLPPGTGALERHADGLAKRFDPNIKLPNWNAWHGGQRVATPYAAGYWRAALRTANMLHAAPATTLDHTLQALGHERRGMAMALGSENAHLFGKYLDPAMQEMQPHFVTTPIAGNYLKLAHVSDFLDRLKRGDTAEYGDALVTNTHADGLRSFAFQEPLLGGGGCMTLSGISEDAQGTMTWAHAQFSAKRLEHLEGLFAAAQAPAPAGLSAEARLNDVCERVGKLHYFLAHCCPFARGSAAVSDMLTTAILHNHGYLHAGWKPNVSADVVALVTPSSAAYAKAYRSLMSPGPTPI